MNWVQNDMVLIFFFFIILYSITYLWKNYYIKIPLDKVGIIYGYPHKVIDSTTGEIRLKGFKVVKKGYVFVTPIFEIIEYLPLSLYQLNLTSRKIRTKDGHWVVGKIEIWGHIRSDDDSLDTAITLFGNMSAKEIHANMISHFNVVFSNDFEAHIQTLESHELYRNNLRIKEPLHINFKKSAKLLGFEITLFGITHLIHSSSETIEFTIPNLLSLDGVELTFNVQFTVQMCTDEAALEKSKKLFDNMTLEQIDSIIQILFEVSLQDSFKFTVSQFNSKDLQNSNLLDDKISKLIIQLLDRIGMKLLFFEILNVT